VLWLHTMWRSQVKGMGSRQAGMKQDCKVDCFTQAAQCRRLGKTAAHRDRLVRSTAVIKARQPHTTTACMRWVIIGMKLA
jgi:hypothetical protein